MRGSPGLCGTRFLTISLGTSFAPHGDRASGFSGVGCLASPGNLDHKGGDEIFALLREQQEKRGCTLVVVTHDRRFIQPDDHVVEIEDGRILA